MRALGRVALVLLSAIVALVIVGFVTARPGDPAVWPPAPGGAVAEVYVVNHGYHTGLVMLQRATDDLAQRQKNVILHAVTRRFATYQWIEIGWGDDAFYRSAPDSSSVTWVTAALALFRPGNPSVLHVVGLKNDPRLAFPNSKIIRVNLTLEGYLRLLDFLDGSFATSGADPIAEDLGTGLHGPSLFFRGSESFNMFNGCNHWIARMLSVAGVPTTPVLATTSQGLFLDLEWRAGLHPLSPLQVGDRGS